MSNTKTRDNTGAHTTAGHRDTVETKPAFKTTVVVRVLTVACVLIAAAVTRTSTGTTPGSTSPGRRSAT